MNTNAPFRLGARLAGRYRVDLVLSDGAVPALLCTRFPDGAKVLVQLVRHPLTRDHGPALLRLAADARVAHLERADLLRVHEFGIDEKTQERFLVVDYDRSRTAAQIVSDDGRERRTLDAFLEVAAALLEQAAPDSHPSAAPIGVEAPPPDDWVEVDDAEVQVTAPERTGLKKNELYWLVGAVATAGVMWAMIFADERAVQPPTTTYPWYHDYSSPTGMAEEDPTDPFGNDPDVIAARGMRVTVHSTPSGADIWNGVKRLGRTPVAIERPGRGMELNLRVSKPGFGETSMTLSSNSPHTVSVTLGGGSIGDETAKFIEELKVQNKTAIEEIRGEDAARGKTDDPTSIGEPALPKGPDLYDDD